MKTIQMKSVVLAVMLGSSALVQADPAPFGMALGKMTVTEFTKKYTAEHRGVNKYSQGKMFSVPTHSLNFDGLQELTAIFDAQDKLVAVLTTFPKRRFGQMNELMKSKYKLVEQTIPFVGDTSATYRDGKTDITLDAPHMSFTMTVNYINQDFQKTVQRVNAQEQKKQQQRELNQL